MNYLEKKPDSSPLDQARMSFGDHLMELRSRLIKCIFGLVICSVISLFFTRYILGFIAIPLLAAMEAAGHDPQLVATTLTGPFVTYFKIAMYSGIFIASPWIFYQLWSFVAVGLYPHERRYVNIIMPFSALLFILGGAFFIVIVAPISFNYFITFGDKLSTPSMAENSRYYNLVKKILPAINPAAESSPANETLPPANKSVETPAKNNLPKPLAKPWFTLSDYVSLVIVMALAFGAAFQMPLVVFFLGRLGLVKLKTLKSARKYVLFGIVIVAAILTPPDVISQIALTIPMYVLYEIGILLLRYWPQHKT